MENPYQAPVECATSDDHPPFSGEDDQVEGGDWRASFALLVSFAALLFKLFMLLLATILLTFLVEMVWR